MTMMKWRGQELDTLFSEMDSTFNSIFDNDFFSKKGQWLAAPMSAVSRKTFKTTLSETGMALSIDVPGVKAQDVTVDVQGHEVNISARRDDFDSTYRYLIHETYDMSTLKALLEDGVLTLSLDKRAEVHPRRIEVAVAQK